MPSVNISQHQVLKGLEYSYENYEKWGTRRGASKHRNDGRNLQFMNLEFGLKISKFMRMEEKVSHSITTL